MFDHTVLRHNGEGRGANAVDIQAQPFFVVVDVIQPYCVNI